MKKLKLGVPPVDLALAGLGDHGTKVVATAVPEMAGATVPADLSRAAPATAAGLPAALETVADLSGAVLATAAGLPAAPEMVAGMEVGRPAAHAQTQAVSVAPEVLAAPAVGTFDRAQARVAAPEVPEGGGFGGPPPDFNPDDRGAPNKEARRAKEKDRRERSEKKRASRSRPEPKERGNWRWDGILDED